MFEDFPDKPLIGSGQFHGTIDHIFLQIFIQIQKSLLSLLQTCNVQAKNNYKLAVGYNTPLDEFDRAIGACHKAFRVLRRLGRHRLC